MCRAATLHSQRAEPHRDRLLLSARNNDSGSSSVRRVMRARVCFINATKLGRDGKPETRWRCLMRGVFSAWGTRRPSPVKSMFMATPGTQRHVLAARVCARALSHTTESLPSRGDGEHVLDTPKQKPLGRVTRNRRRRRRGLVARHRSRRRRNWAAAAPVSRTGGGRRCLSGDASVSPFEILVHV